MRAFRSSARPRHSKRNASVGLTDAARHAGSIVAPRATSASNELGKRHGASGADQAHRVPNDKPDPLSWIIVLALLGITMISASWRPARTAARVDPVLLLKDE
jgi:hypothetical protein